VRAEWHGGSLRTTYNDVFVAQRDKLADAAKAGEWQRVFDQLESHPGLVNSARIGGRSGYTPLHQAAWHGADASTIVRLIDLGAWRTLRTLSGQRPVDIARERGHFHLVEALQPVVVHPVSGLDALQDNLHSLIRERAGDLVEEHRLRLPELQPLTEMPDPQLWFPVPGMYGGFACRFDGQELIVESWCRISGGSGQTHRISADGVRLVESGWG
jgi:hypothetical protein